MGIIIVAVLIVVILASLICMNQYRTLTAMIEMIHHNKQQLDTQLERRFATFESLIASIHQFMDYERSTLKDVITLRARAEAALSMQNEKARINAENEISKIATRLPVIFEHYPELKSGKNILQLQEEVANNENKLAYAKEAYNQSAHRFLIKKSSLIERMLIKFFADKLDKTYLVW